MKLFATILIACLFIFNMLFFSFKTTKILAEYARRDTDTAVEFIKTHIPKGSRVIGDPLYYYAVVNSGSEYHYYNLYNTLEERELALRTKFDYDYMIVSGVSLSRNPFISQYFLKKNQMDSIASLQIPPNELALFLNKLGLTSTMEKSGYNCILYKRRK